MKAKYLVEATSLMRQRERLLLSLQWEHKADVCVNGHMITVDAVLVRPIISHELTWCELRLKELGVEL